MNTIFNILFFSGLTFFIIYALFEFKYFIKKCDKEIIEDEIIIKKTAKILLGVVPVPNFGTSFSIRNSGIKFHLLKNDMFYKWTSFKEISIKNNKTKLKIGKKFITLYDLDSRIFEKYSKHIQVYA